MVYDAQWFLAVTKIVHVASCMGNIDHALDRFKRDAAETYGGS